MSKIDHSQFLLWDQTKTANYSVQVEGSIGGNQDQGSHRRRAGGGRGRGSIAPYQGISNPTMVIIPNMSINIVEYSWRIEDWRLFFCSWHISTWKRRASTWGCSWPPRGWSSRTTACPWEVKRWKICKMVSSALFYEVEGTTSKIMGKTGSRWLPSMMPTTFSDHSDPLGRDSWLS